MKLVSGRFGSIARGALLSVLAGALSASVVFASSLPLSTLASYSNRVWAESVVHNAGEAEGLFLDSLAPPRNNSGFDAAADRDAADDPQQHCTSAYTCDIGEFLPETSGLSSLTRAEGAYESRAGSSGSNWPALNWTEFSGFHFQVSAYGAPFGETLSSPAVFERNLNVFELANLGVDSDVRVVAGAGAAAARVVTVAPEPSTLILFGSALMAAALCGRRKLARVSISSGNKQTSNTRSDTPQRPVR